MAPADRPSLLKALFRILSEEESTDSFQKRLKRFNPPISISEIARASQELIGAGWAPSVLRDLFRNALPLSSSRLPDDRGPSGIPGHPVHTLLRENEALGALIQNRIRPHMRDYADSGSQASLILLREDVARLAGIEIHYAKKENLMFPMLEQRGISAPSRVMRDADDRVRTSLRSIRTSLDSLDDPRKTLSNRLEDELERIQMIAELEQRFLIPLLLENLQEGDWSVIASGEHDFGYFLIESVASWHPAGAPQEEEEKDNRIPFETGQLEIAEAEGLLNSLPMDLTFIGPLDRIRFYTQGAGITKRSAELIGQSVLLCHKEETRPAVQDILDRFRNGSDERVEQVMEIGGRNVQIRYLAVRGPDGTYLGTLETAQEVGAGGA